MDIETLAEQVLQSVEALLAKRLQPVVADIAALRVEMAGAGFLKAADVAGFAKADDMGRRIDELAAHVADVAKDVAARPTLDLMRAEQVSVASKAAADIAQTIRVPQDGKSVTVEDVRPLLEQMVAAIQRPKDGSPGRDGVDGKDGAPGKDGRDGVDGKDGAPGRDGADGKDGAPGRDGVDGKNGADGINGKDGASGRDGKDAEVDYTKIYAAASDLITQKISELPVAKDGAPGRDGIDGKDGIDGRDGKDGSPGMRGEPGRDGKDADLATLREIVSIAVKAAVAEIPVPNDGAPGRDADPVDMRAVEAEIESRVRRAVEALPRPKDGADGVGFDDFSLDLKDDGRTLVFRFAGGGREKTFEIVAPWQIYRGVWKAGDFTQGDVVTYGGSQWVAKRDTHQTPGTGDDWVLCVKRGKDGKDGSGA